MSMCISSETSQDETKDYDDKQNGVRLAHQLASQQDEEPIQQEDDLPNDSMADQADEPDFDDEDNALEQQGDDDDDDQLSAQGKT